MNSEIFQNISKIIERDSKSTTYKFALLRGVIDIIQENSPYIHVFEKHVTIPTGLLVEKWLLYYYPIFEAGISTTQINGSASLAFGPQFSDFVEIYKSRGGFSAFYNDYTNKGIPKDLRIDFERLVKKIRGTITDMPMKYIGRSIHEDFYSIFRNEQGSFRVNRMADKQDLIESLGSFSLPRDYYEAFKLLGSFINGQDSILFKWAEFSAKASNHSLDVNQVLNQILRSPITEREIKDSKRIYSDILLNKGPMNCVWSDVPLKVNQEYNIDHVIPFSIWKNNDLWNLLPAHSKINNQKRDKIPSPALIERRKNQIIHYWEIILDNQQARFQKEMQVNLLGNLSFSTWKDNGIKQLQNNCRYLIEKRGFEEWNIQN